MGHHFNGSGFRKKQSTVHWSPGSQSTSKVPKAIPGLLSHRRAFILPVQDTLLFTWFSVSLLCFFLPLLLLPSGYFSVYLSHEFYLLIASICSWSLLSLCLASWLLFCLLGASVCMLLCRMELITGPRLLFLERPACKLGPCPAFESLGFRRVLTTC